MATNKHPHAENMLLYAQDAMTTDRPWELWEFRRARQEPEEPWRTPAFNPVWAIESEYRRKPRVRNLNGYEYPEPESKALEDGTVYWIPAMSIPDCLYVGLCWSNSVADFLLLRRGVIHLTKEAAETHAKAIFFAGGGK